MKFVSRYDFIKYRVSKPLTSEENKTITTNKSIKQYSIHIIGGH